MQSLNNVLEAQLTIGAVLSGITNGSDDEIGLIVGCLERSPHLPGALFEGNDKEEQVAIDAATKMLNDALDGIIAGHSDEKQDMLSDLFMSFGFSRRAKDLDEVERMMGIMCEEFSGDISEKGLDMFEYLERVKADMPDSYSAEQEAELLNAIAFAKTQVENLVKKAA